MAHYERQIFELQRELASKTKDIENLRNDSNYWKSKCDQLQKTDELCDKLRVRLSQQVEENQVLLTKMQMQSMQIDQSTHQSNHLKNDQRELASKYSNLRKLYDRLKQTSIQYKDEAADWRDRFDRSLKALHDLKSLKLETDMLAKQNISMLQLDIQALTEENELLTQKLTQVPEDLLYKEEEFLNQIEQLQYLRESARRTAENDAVKYKSLANHYQHDLQDVADYVKHL